MKGQDGERKRLEGGEARGGKLKTTVGWLGQRVIFSLNHAREKKKDERKKRPGFTRRQPRGRARYHDG